jgi:hypothetical protein
MDTKVLSVPYFFASLVFTFWDQHNFLKLLAISGNHISPTIPPIPPEPEPTAPSAHPIWTLPPPPPNLGTFFIFVLFSYVYHFKTYVLDLILSAWCVILLISYLMTVKCRLQIVIMPRAFNRSTFGRPMCLRSTNQSRNSSKC